MANNIKPIWEDYYVTFKSDESPVSYSIQVNGEPVFYGKAWCPPSNKSGTYKTKINSICENYIFNEIDDFEGITENGKTIQQTDAIKKFTIINEDTRQPIDEVTFIYDYSHDKSVDYNNTVNMSRPINGKGKEGMYFLTTTTNGSIVTTLISKAPTIGYYIINDCASKYAIYYLNKYGGWDSFLIEGFVTEKQSFARNTVKRDYNNSTLQLGTTQYLTEITDGYELHTGWLNEHESKTLAENLFQSNRLFLHNIETDEIIPILITDAEAATKTRKNSARKLLNYTINAVASHTRHNKNK